MQLKRVIPLFNIYWDEDDIAQIVRTIERGGNWAAGPDIEIFEGMVAEYLGAGFCTVYNSGTSALQAVLMAYGIGPGDEVIVPSFTFIATANSPLFVGARPVFADIEDRSYGLDPEDVEKKITPRTRAILPIHYAGFPCMVEELRKIADAHSLLLIEDAAEAFGAGIGIKKAGTFGHAAVLSFCQNKVITTGEGGAVVTNNSEVYRRLKLIRSHGRLETGDYFSSPEYMDYITLGYNFRLSDISAALGIAQMKKVDRVIEMRRRNAGYLGRQLASIDRISVPEMPESHFNVYQMYPVRVKADGDLRDRLAAYLREKGIATRVNFYPVHLTKFYRDRFGHHDGELPVTEMVSRQILTLPMYPGLTENDMDYIAEQIKSFFDTL